MNKAKKLWQEVKEYMNNDLPSVLYTTCILPLEPLDIRDSCFYLQAPNSFTQNIVSTKYKEDILNYIEHITKEKMTVEILVAGDKIDLSNPRDEEDRIEKSEKKEEKATSRDPSVPAPPGMAFLWNDERERRRRGEKLLSPKYTFDNFIMGDSNAMALKTAMKTAEYPPVQYNPLFIWGGPGLGKTHLMQAIAHQILKNNPQMKVLYIASETFTNDMINTLGEKDSRISEAFRYYYREVDVLIVDDVQFMSGKSGTQGEFFHTFNHLHLRDKQIILSSDRPPKEIPQLEDRLISRFESGISVSVSQPDYETRMAILKAMIKSEKTNLPPEILDYIAMNVCDNIRELKGAFITAAAAYNVYGNRKDVGDYAKDVLGHYIHDQKKRSVTIDQIKEKCAETFNISLEMLDSKKRSKNIVNCRQMAMYLSRQMTELSLVDIARAFSRDHSTIVHGVDKIQQEIDRDPVFKERVERLMKYIQNN